MAANFYNLELLEEILKWTKHNLATEKVNKLSFNTENMGRKIFNMAANQRY